MPNYDVSRIAGNIGALNALNSMTKINKQLSVHQARLSSGKRINSAEDDPAGLTIATKLQARSEGLKVALDNIGDAKNLLSVAESGLGRINDILVQMRNKSEAAASDTMGTSERDAIKTQLLAYATQIDDIVGQTKWNGNKLIDGSYSSATLTFQTGADTGDQTTLTGLANVNSAQLGVVTNAGTSTLGSTSFDPLLGVTTATSGVRSGSAGNARFTPGGVAMAELATGTYRVVVNINGANSTAQLFDANGNIMDVDADGSSGGSLDNKVTFNYAADTASPLDFGNGLRIVVGTTGAAGTETLAAGTHAAQVISYTKSGTAQISASDAGTFSSYLGTLDTAMNTVNTQLTKIGALNGRLTFKEDQVSAAQINVEGAYNRIMNANMAEEQVNASKFQILQQTSSAMLAQANAAPQFLLSLFR